MLELEPGRVATASRRSSSQGSTEYTLSIQRLASRSQKCLIVATGSSPLNNVAAMHKGHKGLRMAFYGFWLTALSCANLNAATQLYLPRSFAPIEMTQVGIALINPTHTPASI